MSSDRCFACGNDRWGGLFRIRLVAGDGDEIEADICEGCWKAARNLEERRIRAHERQLLRDWFPPQAQEARNADHA